MAVFPLNVPDTWIIMRSGRRSSDPWAAVHFGQLRFCFGGPTRNLREAEELEHIGLDERLIERGVVLFAVGWRCPYVMQRRAMWNPDDYFIHAAKLFGQKGIESP